MNDAAREELDRYLEKSPRIGDVPLFPSHRDETKPFRGDAASKWLLKAEKAAGEAKLAGGIWHPYRRLFAIELESRPVHDVAAAGGWKSVQTVQRIYQTGTSKGVLSAVEKIGNGA